MRRSDKARIDAQLVRCKNLWTERERQKQLDAQQAQQTESAAQAQVDVQRVLEQRRQAELQAEQAKRERQERIEQVAAEEKRRLGGDASLSVWDEEFFICRVVNRRRALGAAVRACERLTRRTWRTPSRWRAR